MVLYKLFSDNISFPDIFNIINKDDLFSKDEIYKNVENSLNELKSRESVCDVIISDYVEENYNKKELFYVPNHPTNDVMKVITKRLLEHLSFKVENIDDSGIVPNNTNEILLYPCVRNILNIQWEKDKYIFSKYMHGEDKVSIVEYIHLYQEFCFRDYRYGQESMNIIDMVDINKDSFEVKPGSIITIKEKICSISICVACKNINVGLKLFSIPKEFAPFKGYYFSAHIKGGGNIIAYLDDSGDAEVIEICDEQNNDEMLINTSYLLN